MSNINCVVTTSRQFKETAKKFDVSIGTLRDIVFKYQNSEEGKVGDFPSDEYIKNKISGESIS